MCKEQSNEEETDSEEPNTYWLGFCECCYSTIMEGSVLLSLVGCHNALSNYKIPKIEKSSDVPNVIATDDEDGKCLVVFVCVCVCVSCM